jgi:hypothetical protein
MLQYIKSKNILTLHIIYAVLVKSFKCYSPFSFSTVIGAANLCYFQNVSKYEDAIRILKSLIERVRDSRWDIRLWCTVRDGLSWSGSISDYGLWWVELERSKMKNSDPIYCRTMLNHDPDYSGFGARSG